MQHINSVVHQWIFFQSLVLTERMMRESSIYEVTRKSLYLFVEFLELANSHWLKHYYIDALSLSCFFLIV